jgi:hypothetical protein
MKILSKSAGILCAGYMCFSFLTFQSRSQEADSGTRQIISTDRNENQQRTNGIGGVVFYIQKFDWQEYNTDGTKLLSESGNLIGLSLAHIDVYEGWRGYGVELGGYGGTVDYDGQTMGGTAVQSESEYFGLYVTGDVLGRVMLSKKSWINGFLGLGIKWWQRDIKSVDDVSLGYEEEWMNIYGRVGLGAACLLGKGIGAFIKGGWKIPVETTERIDLSEYGIVAVDLEPEQRISPFIETGLSWKALFLSVCYDTLEFNRSDSESRLVYSSPYIYEIEFYQPESEAKTLSLMVGLGGIF